jgi:hypothetical protein
MRGWALFLAAALLAAGSAWAAGSGNPMNDHLLALPQSQQAQTLARSFRNGCVGVSAFPMGVVSTANWKFLAYWSVRCKNGKSYVVQIPPNVKAPAVVADCSVLRGTGKECFKKF